MTLSLNLCWIIFSKVDVYIVYLVILSKMIKKNIYYKDLIVILNKNS